MNAFVDSRIPRLVLGKRLVRSRCENCKPRFAFARLRKLIVVPLATGTRHVEDSGLWRRMQIQPRRRWIDVPAVAFGFCQQLRITCPTGPRDNTASSAAEHLFTVTCINNVSVGVNRLSRPFKFRQPRFMPSRAAIFIYSKRRVDACSGFKLEAITQIAIENVGSQRTVFVSDVCRRRGSAVPTATAVFSPSVWAANGFSASGWHVAYEAHYGES